MSEAPGSVPEQPSTEKKIDYPTAAKEGLIPNLVDTEQSSQVPASEPLPQESAPIDFTVQPGESVTSYVKRIRGLETVKPEDVTPQLMDLWSKNKA